MICFSMDQEDNSAENVQTWINEVRGVDHRKPIVFVLTKKDLRDDENVEIKFDVKDLYKYMNKH